MVRTRLALVMGFVLLGAACLLPCGTFGELSAASLPYQDPTPEMLRAQADEVASLQAALRRYLAISALLACAGLIASGYGVWRWRAHRGAMRKVADDRGAA